MQKLVAAKIFDQKHSYRKEIQAEVDVLKLLGQHENIVSLRDILYLKEETIMVTDLVEGGELFDYIVEMVSCTNFFKLLYAFFNF